MCPHCVRPANIAVSSLHFVLGRLFTMPMPDAARGALGDFARSPSDQGLQVLVVALRDHQLFAQIHGVAREVELFGGIEAVLEAADQHHVDDFQSALRSMGGSHE